MDSPALDSPIRSRMFLMKDNESTRFPDGDGIESFRPAPAIGVREESTMDATSYCESMATELEARQSRLYDLARKFHREDCGDKAKVLSQVNDLHMIIEEFGDRINKLRTECPTEWAPVRDETPSRFIHRSRSWESVWDDVSPGQVGG
jgi:hypothetical protein